MKNHTRIISRPGSAEGTRRLLGISRKRAAEIKMMVDDIVAKVPDEHEVPVLPSLEADVATTGEARSSS